MTPEQLRTNRLLVPMFRASMKVPKHKRKPRRKKKKQVDGKMRTRTKRYRDAAVARHRAAAAVRSPKSKRDMAEVIASLSKEERAALAANEHVITAVEKIIEAMLFRFA